MTVLRFERPEAAARTASAGRPAWAGQLSPHWPALMAGVFVLAWALAAYRPLFPSDWALENVLSLLTAWFVLRNHRRHPLSNTAYTLLCLYAITHEIGSHYTYAEVPFDDWIRSAFGFSVNEAFGFTRNHYDRLVHFLFGLLCYRPLRELLAPAVRFPALRFAPVAVVATISLLYEQVEMAAAYLFGGDLGMAYLGTQGDLWDAQKDSLMALSGVLLAIAISWSVAAASKPAKTGTDHH